jgi:histidinol dehydrogenase
VLVTTSLSFADAVGAETIQRAKEFSRNAIIERSLQNSYALVVETMDRAIQFSNDYAPEHLIINTAQAESLAPRITNAGSVFLGRFAPVTAGDYASGTNHTLPTSGTARWCSGVSVESYCKMVTFQILTEEGLRRLEPVLTDFARAEGLTAHGRAVTSRLEGKEH